MEELKINTNEELEKMINSLEKKIRLCKYQIWRNRRCIGDRTVDYWNKKLNNLSLELEKIKDVLKVEGTVDKNKILDLDKKFEGFAISGLLKDGIYS